MKAMHLAAALLLAAAPAFAQEKKPNAEDVNKDIAAHRQMAQVRENAAKRLEVGKPEKECHDQLQKDCKGVGIGKYCGLRHRH